MDKQDFIRILHENLEEDADYKFDKKRVVKSVGHYNVTERMGHVGLNRVCDDIMLLPTVFDDITATVSGNELAVVTEISGSKALYITKGDAAVEIDSPAGGDIYERISVLSRSQCAVVEKDSRQGLISIINNEFILPLQYKGICRLDGARYLWGAHESGRIDYLDMESGNIVAGIDMVMAYDHPALRIGRRRNGRVAVVDDAGTYLPEVLRKTVKSNGGRLTLTNTCLGKSHKIDVYGWILNEQ